MDRVCRMCRRLLLPPTLGSVLSELSAGLLHRHGGGDGGGGGGGENGENDENGDNDDACTGGEHARSENAARTGTVRTGTVTGTDTRSAVAYNCVFTLGDIDRFTLLCGGGGGGTKEPQQPPPQRLRDATATATATGGLPSAGGADNHPQEGEAEGEGGGVASEMQRAKQ